MKKGLKSFLSKFLVCFKGRKVSSSLIRPEIEEEEPTLELKAVVCEEDSAAGLNVGQESAAGIEAGEKPATGIEVGEEELAAGVEAGEEPAMGIEPGEEVPAAGIGPGEEPAAGVEAGEEPAMWIEAGEEEPAAGIGPGEEPATGSRLARRNRWLGLRRMIQLWGSILRRRQCRGLRTVRRSRRGGLKLTRRSRWREEPAKGTQEPKVGIQAEEEPAAEMKAGEKELAVGIEADEEKTAARSDAGDEKLAARIQSGQGEPTAGIQASQGELASGIEAVVETLSGIDAGDEESMTEINGGEELATRIEACQEERAAAIDESLVRTEAKEELAGKIKAGEEESAAGIEEAVVGIEAKEKPGMGIKAGKEVLAAAIEEPVVRTEAEEEPKRVEAGGEEPEAVVGEPVMRIEAEPTMGLKAGKKEQVVGIEEPVMGMEKPVPVLESNDAWNVALAEAPAIEESVAGLKDDGEMDEDDFEGPILEGFVLDVQPADAAGDSVATQGASFSGVLEAFISMNLKLHTLMVQLASLNAHLESHGGVNSSFEDKFSWKLLGGLYDSISPTVEVLILELAAALDAEQASPFANVEIHEEVNLEENSEEDIMKHGTILEVREACVSADLEVDDVGCSSNSSYSGYLRDGRYFGGKTRYSGYSREGRNFGGKTRVWRRVCMERLGCLS